MGRRFAPHRKLEETLAPEWASLGWGALAFLTHAAALALIGLVPHTSVEPRADLDEVTVRIVSTPPPKAAEPAPAPEPPTPEPEPEPPAPEPEQPPQPIRPTPIRTRPTARAAPKEPPPRPPKAAETPVPFDNVVLTNKGGQSAWAVAAGTGRDRAGPIGNPNAAVTGRSREGVPGGAIDGEGDTPILPVGDLSRAPQPPSQRLLRTLLEQHYPRRAKREGVTGRSDVRLTVGADGTIRDLRVLSERPRQYDFGGACLATLRQAGRWQPPVGPDGRRVATRVTFACRFEIRSF